MRAMLLRTILCAALGLLPAILLGGCASRYRNTVYATTQYLDWSERGAGRLQSLNDSGPAYGMGYLLETPRAQLRAEVIGAEIDLEAFSPDSTTRVTGDTGYLLFDLAADVSVLAPSAKAKERGEPRTWDLFCGGGLRAWHRDLRDGLSQSWYSLSTHVGGEYSHSYGANRRWFVRGRVGATVRNRTRFSQNDLLFFSTELATVDPKPGPLARLDIGLEHGGLHLGAFLDWTSYGESNPNNGTRQPDSSMTRIGLNVGFRW